MEYLLDTIFNTKCLFCNNESSHFCKECLSKCEILNSLFCVNCDKVLNKSHLNSCKNITNRLILYSVYKYDGLVRQCIKKSKFNSKYFSSLKFLTKEAASFMKNRNYNFEDYLLVPIPLSKNKLRERGFNQVEIICNELKRELSLEKDYSILTRIKDTKVQYENTRKQRFENIKGAFEVGKNKRYKVENSKILLVDDISTTGATLLEASKTLYTAGAKKVICFTLSKRLNKV